MLPSTFVNEMRTAGYTPNDREVYWEDVIKAIGDIKEKKCQMTSDARSVALYLFEIRKKEQKQNFLDIKGDFVDAYDDARQGKLDLEVPSDASGKADI